jgi:hypothetical protein
MTKNFCDLCSAELTGEHAGVSIMAKGCDYHRQDFCLSCFYDRKNWSKIHVRPGKMESIYVRMKKTVKNKSY